ncbi:MAG TPA: OmpH family outer membrane protein [Chitinophagales bacterium]|nr:OmpH family outer membrane protein [Chitinophagales bacterium]
MKKFLLSLAIVLMASYTYNATAQIKAYKFGYVNSLELLEAMPEKKSADTELEKYANNLQTSMEKMYTEYQKKIQDFQKGAQEGTLTETDQEFKAREIQDLENRIQDFQEGAEEKIARKRQTLFQPLINKINKAIEDVAKDNGFTYIFDSSAGSILHASEDENIINLLKKKLDLPVK